MPLFSVNFIIRGCWVGVRENFMLRGPLPLKNMASDGNNFANLFEEVVWLGSLLFSLF